MPNKTKIKFTAFTHFFQEFKNLPFNSKLILTACTFTGIGVCGVLYWLVTYLAEALKALHSIDSNLVSISQNLQETQVELIKIQFQLEELKSQQDSASVLKHSTFFTWKNALLITGVGIFVGVVVVGAYAYINHEILQDLSQIAGSKDVSNFFWESIDNNDPNFNNQENNRFEEYDRGI